MIYFKYATTITLDMRGSREGEDRESEHPLEHEKL